MIHNNLKKNMDNLHFIHNNILTKFFKELTKYKNDSIVFKLYIYIGIILYILLYIFKCIHVYAWDYKLVINYTRSTMLDWK